LRALRLLPAARPTDPLQIPLALSLTAAIVFVVANVTPLIGLSAVGRHASTTIVGGAWQLWLEGETDHGRHRHVLRGDCAGFHGPDAGRAAPGEAAARRLPHWGGEMLRWCLHMQPWSMYDVMSLGILVALIKIAQLASVNPGVGDVRDGSAGGAAAGDAWSASTPEKSGSWSPGRWRRGLGAAVAEENCAGAGDESCG
jgi:paraquat-inducible protein A